jgi:hypothetical protein
VGQPASPLTIDSVHLEQFHAAFKQQMESESIQGQACHLAGPAASLHSQRVTHGFSQLIEFGKLFERENT